MSERDHVGDSLPLREAADFWEARWQVQAEDRMIVKTKLREPPKEHDCCPGCGMGASTFLTRREYREHQRSCPDVVGSSDV